MRFISEWNHFKEYGIRPLTGEACAFGLRILCDLTEEGAALLGRYFGTPVNGTANWNSGAVASIMLPRELMTPLAKFILFELGAQAVAVAPSGAVYEVTGSPEDVNPELFRVCRNPRNPGASVGDRNVHQMSGRVA